MENLHPLVIGIRNEENYNKLKNMIKGIGRIESGITAAVAYGKFLQEIGRSKEISGETQREKDLNTRAILELLPRIIIPKGALIFHSNKYTSVSLNDACNQLTQDDGWYPPVPQNKPPEQQCHTCRIAGVAPSEIVGNPPRMCELLNPNFWVSRSKSCICDNTRQHRMFGNFNFTGNYEIAVSNAMLGTHAYIVLEDIHVLDATRLSVELGYSIKNETNIGDLSVVKGYCIENNLDGLAMFDTIDIQNGINESNEQIKKGANNSCYIYDYLNQGGTQSSSYLCPEVVLFHNNNDQYWQSLIATNPPVINIGTRKLRIMGMVDIYNDQTDGWSTRDEVSQRFDTLFSKYMTYVQQYNAEQSASGTGKNIQIEDIQITYTDNNLYKMILNKNGSVEEQNILFELIQLAWTSMARSRQEYCITSSSQIDIDPSLSFFMADETADELVDIPLLDKPINWIKLYSHINVDFDLKNRLERNPLYDSEAIFTKILNAHRISPEKRYQLYIISCLTILPDIEEDFGVDKFDIIDVLEGKKDDRTIDDSVIQFFYNLFKKSIKSVCRDHFQQKNAFIVSKFNIPFILDDTQFDQLIRLSNECTTFIYTKNKISLIDTNSFASLITYLLKPLIPAYNIKFLELFNSYAMQIMTIINSHFSTIGEIIKVADTHMILYSFQIKFNQNKYHELLMNRMFESYKILDYKAFTQEIDHMIIDFIKFCWDIFTEFMISNIGPLIGNTVNTKEYMDGLFIKVQDTLHSGSLFYYGDVSREVVMGQDDSTAVDSTAVDSTAVDSTGVSSMEHSPLYYHSPNKNIVYVYLENETVNIQALYDYYHKNKDSDILDLIYELKKLG